jgi:hypothetical protein
MRTRKCALARGAFGGSVCIAHRSSLHVRACASIGASRVPCAVVARFSCGFTRTGDESPFVPSVFRRERCEGRLHSDFGDQLETRENKLWRGLQRFSTARFRAVA